MRSYALLWASKLLSRPASSRSNEYESFMMNSRTRHSPAPTWRMNPPRTSSLWLAASASAGASRSVGRNSCEARAITVVRADYSASGISDASAHGIACDADRRPCGSSARTLIHIAWDRLQRNQRGFRHCERCGLRHLQSLGALHAVGDPLVDLVEQLVDQDVD